MPFVNCCKSAASFECVVLCSCKNRRSRRGSLAPYYKTVPGTSPILKLSRPTVKMGASDGHWHRQANAARRGGTGKVLSSCLLWTLLWEQLKRGRQSTFESPYGNLCLEKRWIQCSLYGGHFRADMPSHGQVQIFSTRSSPQLRK